MPASAYALVAFFSAVSMASGLVAWRVVGPPSRLAAVPPAAASFAALYIVGHRLGLSVGPTVDLFGFEVALPFDLVVALGTAATVAAAERAVWRLGRRGPSVGQAEPPV